MKIVQIKLNKFSFLRNKKPLLKNAVKGFTRSNGRNNSGKITVFHKGGGHKRKFRKINFKRKNSENCVVTSIEYDPNRNSYIASVYDFVSFNFYYIIAPKNLKIGDIVKTGVHVEPLLGNSLPLSEIPTGSFVHNLMIKKNKNSQVSRAAGSFSTVKEKTLSTVKLELSSGKHILISTKCYATMGIVSNELFFLHNKKKAGRSRWLNIRPTTRGVAMNPVDHPHGGGEGKKSGKRFTPWGKPN